MHVLLNPNVKKVVELMVQLWNVEQTHEHDTSLDNYFSPLEKTPLYRYWELGRNGKGSPTNYTGMTWSGFRPSDEKCMYHYIVPANMFASVALGYTEELALVLWKDWSLARKARKLKDEIDQGIRTYGIVKHSKYGNIYAYEVDGRGNALLMDDANVPSLLSIPYLGWQYDPIIYNNTKRFILSPDNPTFGTNTAGTITGVGSTHTQRNYIWPMSQIIEGLTSTNVSHKLEILNVLLATDGGSGAIHESYDPNFPLTFTRAWFCWADSLFAEFVMSLGTEFHEDTCPGKVPVDFAHILNSKHPAYEKYFPNLTVQTNSWKA